MIKIVNAFVDLVASTDSDRSSDRLLVINGETKFVDVGADIVVIFNGKKYTAKVLDDETWFLNILNSELINLSTGEYIVSAEIGTARTEYHVYL